MRAIFADHDECGDWTIDPKVLDHIKNKLVADTGCLIFEEEIEKVILTLFNLRYIDFKESEQKGM